MPKELWYSKTESKLYEVKTFDKAIYHMQQRGEDITEKLQHKKDMEEIINSLPAEFQEFVRIVYMSPNMSPEQAQGLLSLSEPTFYRRKRSVVKQVAQYLGYI